MMADFLKHRMNSMISFSFTQGGGQQDSHEYMRLLLDGLHNEELKIAKAKNLGQNLVSTQLIFL